MPIPFGVGIGDFLAVGKLIGQIAVELRENGEAAPDYQSLLLELEALSRALHQLENLQPAKHELIQLNAIRATALTCQRPLEEFLNKISRFERQLGTFNARNNKCKGFPRRMQWRIMFVDDVKQLRSILGSHVATINLLLMTQTIGSVAAAENDRDRLASRLETKILDHKRLLKDIKSDTEQSLEQQRETKAILRDHSVAISNLGSKADQVNQHLQGQEVLIQEVQTIVSNTREQTTSILATATDIFTLATSGAMNLQLIARQLSRMFKLCTRFTTEMQVAMAELMQSFFSLHAILRRIEASLPSRISLPIVQFTDALGESMTLPYQLCQQWSTFRDLLGVMFTNKPGKSRVELGQYLIMHARGGRLLHEASWHHAIKQGDHLSMSIVLDNYDTLPGKCPFPSCQASTEGVEIKNGGQICPECGRWAVVTLQEKSHKTIEFTPDTSNLSSLARDLTLNSLQQDQEVVEEDDEDIELYRQIHVHGAPNVYSDEILHISRPSSALGGDSTDLEAYFEEDKTTVTVATSIEWRRGGEKVYVTGTFYQWNRKHRLHPVEGEPGIVRAIIHVRPGIHHAKFIVDGSVQCSPDLPTTVDFANTIVNYIECF